MPIVKNLKITVLYDHAIVKIQDNHAILKMQK